MKVIVDIPEDKLPELQQYLWNLQYRVFNERVPNEFLEAIAVACAQRTDEQVAELLRIRELSTTLLGKGLTSDQWQHVVNELMTILKLG